MINQSISKSLKQFLSDRIMAMIYMGKIGDALGMPAEIMTPEKIASTFGRIKKYYNAPAGHPWLGDLKAGMWTDDSQLELAVLTSMIRRGGIDLDDLAQEHVKALREKVCGWGGNTTKAVENLAKGVHWSESGIQDAAGNGIAMKISPFGAMMAVDYMLHRAVHSSDHEFEEYKKEFNKHVFGFSLMTHRSKMAIVSGFAQAYAVFACITLPEKDFEDNFVKMIHEACLLGESIDLQDDVEEKLSDRIAELRNTRDYLHLSTKELVEKYGGKGRARFYVLNSLPISYAMFLRGPNDMETLFNTINDVGGDTDTNAAIVGALLGARNGMGLIFRGGYNYLIDGLWRKDEIIKAADEFCETFIHE